MSLTILSGLLVLDMGGQKYPWTHPTILAAAGTMVCAAIAFCAVETYVAVEPIFPLRLMSQRAVITSYALLCFQMVAVTSVRDFRWMAGCVLNKSDDDGSAHVLSGHQTCLDRRSRVIFDPIRGWKHDRRSSNRSLDPTVIPPLSIRSRDIDTDVMRV